jgi:hypothetical protein
LRCLNEGDAGDASQDESPQLVVFDSEVFDFEADERGEVSIDDGTESGDDQGELINDKMETKDTLPLLTSTIQSNALNEIHLEILKHLPRIQDDGTVKDVLNTRQHERMNRGEVDAWLALNPMGHGGNICRPADLRAKACRPANGIWDMESMTKARNCFVVADVIWIPYLFELYEFETLRLHPKFCKGAGVLLCCPYCDTNEFVSQKSKGYSTSTSAKISTYHGLVRHVVRFGKIYTCENPLCVSNKPKLQQNKKQRLSTGTNFSSWTNQVIDSLPENLREKYGGGGNTTKGMFLFSYFKKPFVQLIIIFNIFSFFFFNVLLYL